MKLRILLIFLVIAALSLSGCSIICPAEDTGGYPLIFTMSNVFYGYDKDVSFVSLKDFETLPDVYYESETSTKRVALVSCTVVKDLYGKLEGDMRLTFKVPLDVYDVQSEKYIAPAIISELFSSFTGFYIYIPVCPDENGEDMELISREKTFRSAFGGESITVTDLVNSTLNILGYERPAEASVYQIIPVSERYIDFRTYDKILLKNGIQAVNALDELGDRSLVVDYEECFYDGLDIFNFERIAAVLRDNKFNTFGTQIS